jgi:AcrR family transcriptional regulator
MVCRREQSEKRSHVSRRNPPATRSTLLEAAALLFSERGYSGASVDAISEAAGVTKGAFYYWFHDKADIARDVRHAVFEGLTSRALAHLDLEADVPTLLRSGFLGFVDALADEPAIGFLQETWRMPADADGPFDHEEGVALLAGLLRTGQERGEVVDGDPEVMAIALTAAGSELARDAVNNGRRHEAVATFGQMCAALSGDVGVTSFGGGRGCCGSG